VSRIPFVEVVEDSRLRTNLHPASGARAKPERSPDGTGVRIYCVSCSHPGAFVSEDALDLVIYLCDRFSACGCNCMETKGELTLPRLAI
jgi:hypothetical protein